jgi:PAS domain S-box-containing protein
MVDVGAGHDHRAAQRREPVRFSWAPATLSHPHAVLATLADAIGDGLWIVDAEGQVMLMNAVAERLLGWTSPELLGTLVHDRVHVHQPGSTGPSADTCPLLAVLQSGHSVSVGKEVFRRKDGSMVPVAYTASAILSEGQVVGAVVTFRDLTGRALPHLATLKGVARDTTADKRAEGALQETEERFRIMADTAPVLLWMSGPDGLCTFFNQPWLDFTGRTLEQEMGNGWAEGAHPDDLGRCLDTYRSACDARRPFTMEYRLHHADGTYRWVLDTGVPRFQPTGSFAGYIGSAIDITERRRDEDAQRFLATATIVLTASLDYETTLQSLARLIAPALADACVIYGVAPDGALHQVGIAHVDPQKDALAREILRAYPTDPDDPASPLSRTLRTGRAELVPVVSDAMHVAQARDARHLQLLRALNTTSLVAVPLVAHGRTIGALACMAIGDSRRYGPDDLVLIEELAQRAALAVDNARLYAAEQAARRAAERRRDRALSRGPGGVDERA